MREILLDIVKHTGDLGFIEIVKVTGENNETIIEAMDGDKSVVIKGKLKDHESELDGEFGLTQLDLLKFYSNFANYKTDGAVIKTVREKRNDETIPAEISFASASGDSQATYRLMNKDLVPEQFKFLGKDWDLEFEPTKSKIEEFTALASGLLSFEKNFMPKADDDKKLRVYIGDSGAATNKANMVFDDDLETDFPGGIYWPILQTLSILKLATSNNVTPTLALMAKGALKISFESDKAEWEYILPGKRK